MDFAISMEIERRISHRLVNYWQHIKKGRVLPEIGDIDSDDVMDMWENCFIIQINANKNTGEISINYDYVGNEVRPLFVEGYGEIAHLVTLPYDKIKTFYQEMDMTNLPVVENIEEYPLDGHVIKLRQCLLPIGKSGVITHIFGGMRYIYA